MKTFLIALLVLFNSIPAFAGNLRCKKGEEKISFHIQESDWSESGFDAIIGRRIFRIPPASPALPTINGAFRKFYHVNWPVTGCFDAQGRLMNVVDME